MLGAAALFTAAIASAHNPDTSYARCIIADDLVELRLTYDVFTLQLITTVDANRDGRVTRDELRQAVPAIQRFLREHANLEIDGQTAQFGEASEPLWPGETGEGLAAPDWHTAAGLITFPFRQSRPKPPREVALSFDFFDTLTARHTVLGAFEHGAQKEEISFTQAEPDYLFDAAYTAPATPAPIAAPAPPVPPASPAPQVPEALPPRHHYGWLVIVLLPFVLWGAKRRSRNLPS